MTDVIDFSEYLKKQQVSITDKDISAFHKCNVNGEIFYEFGAEYEYEEKTYTIHLWARHWADAEKRLKAIAASGKIYGQICDEVIA